MNSRMQQGTAARSRLFFCASLLMPLVVAAASGTELPEAALTNAADILSLPAQKAASRLRASITGIVTAAQPNWVGRFFIQDATGGVFVDNSGGRAPAPGDLVEVLGVTHQGGYAPCITAPQWKLLGKAPLPEPKPVTIEQLMSGAEDSQRVRISGVVRSVAVNDEMLALELVSGGHRVKAYGPMPKNVHLQGLIGAEAIVSGTAAVGFNAPLRHFITVSLYLPTPEDFKVVKPAPEQPFSEPLTPLNSIAQYRHQQSPLGRVHVQGIVTHQRRGEDLFLRDETGGLQVKTKLAMPVLPGEMVEAVGFPAIENFLPVLEDAVFRRKSEGRVVPIPKEVTRAELQEGRHHADFVLLKGLLVDRLSQTGEEAASRRAFRTTLVLQGPGGVVTAELDTYDRNNQLATIPLGSLLEVRGLCLLESEESGKIRSVRLILPTANDVRIVEKPSPWTRQRLLGGVAILFGVLMIAISWIIMSSRRNAAMRVVIRDKVKAQEQLQQAHDLLEQRVEERTAQLKYEMSARQESEVRFKATLAERTRLAQELHDTLEQSLTGISLQLGTADKLFDKDVSGAKHHLETARLLMKQSQVELRRSIWDLRSRELEQFDFPSALQLSAKNIAERAGLDVKVSIVGEMRPLSEVAEENLLRISQEALTNVIKHAGASRVEVCLEFGPQSVTLRISDNGSGFVPGQRAGAAAGHFGLVGMSERAKRVDGHLVINGVPGKGTTLAVTVPLKPLPGMSGSPSIDIQEGI